MAQQMQGKVMKPSWRRSTDGIHIVDSGSLRVWYALNADDLNAPETYVDLQRLEIGRSLSKYYSYLVFNSDSLCSVWMKENPNAQSVPTKFGLTRKYPYYWSEYQFSEYFKDYQSNLLTEYARMPAHMRRGDSQYSEEIPIQNWTILNDTLTVCGYLCQKATCDFRGRSYAAWFTMDIPIDNGPWKFGGLPGLILKVYDSNHLYNFECVKIENAKFLIKKYDFDRFRSIDRLKLLKFQKEINENYFKASGAISLKGKKFESVPYEPLELK